MKFYYVYILKCSDGSFYTGVTSRLDERVNEHQDGKDKTAYTFFRRPIVLVFYEAFMEIEQAIYFEKKIKRWSRAKKEALVLGNFDRLPLLSECKNMTHHKYKFGYDL
jgi:putative endonuclease